ncbi:hypothetical protein A6R68_00966, partial [Neotoma lepida]
MPCVFLGVTVLAKRICDYISIQERLLEAQVLSLRQGMRTWQKLSTLGSVALVLDVQKKLLCAQWRAALTQNLHQEDVDSVAPAFRDLQAFTARLSWQELAPGLDADQKVQNKLSFSPFPRDAHSLCYTVGNSGSGSWSCEVQGQLNEETFLSYNNTKCHVFSILENRLNATMICEKQADNLKDGFNLFKEKARICCWHEVDGHFNGSLNIDLNGHKMLHVDSITGKLTEVDPESIWMEEMWEKNRDLTTSLKMTSQEDCSACLKEIMSHRDVKPEPT